MILHITAYTAWEAAKADGEYRIESLESEGFIHCSQPEQVVETAARYYRGQTGLVLLLIDPERIKVEYKVEQAKNGQFYPHIYGPLNIDAVIGVKPFPPLPDGSFILPDLTL